jgi:probable rRNA maturation factor
MILNRQSVVRIAAPQLLEFLRAVKRELKLNGAELSVCFVSNREMARLNQSFRGKRGPTDVLSFPAGNGVRQRSGKAENHTSEEQSPSYLGDIAIAPQVAQRNARLSGRATFTELRILILHGVLHLLGYDHETDDGQMERLERRLRERLGLEGLRQRGAGK